jgi:hypothetical protein
MSGADGKLVDITPTRDVLEAGGFYDESPTDPVTGNLRNLRVTLHSSSKLFNDASGPGTCAGHADTISFLGDMLRGSYTQAHARDRKAPPWRPSLPSVGPASVPQTRRPLMAPPAPPWASGDSGHCRELGL